MAAPARTVLTDLPQGHEFALAGFTLTRERVQQYLAAVEDDQSFYAERGACPPMAVAALALGAILESVELPAGTLHTGQEIEQRALVPIDAPITLQARLARRSDRAGLAICVIEFEVTPEGAPEPALVGRSTVMVAPEGQP
jgi:hypothetical protein